MTYDTEYMVDDISWYKIYDRRMLTHNTENMTNDIRLITYGTWQTTHKLISHDTEHMTQDCLDRP